MTGSAKTSKQLKLLWETVAVAFALASAGCSGVVEFEASEGGPAGTSQVEGEFNPSEVSRGTWCHPGIRVGRVHEASVAVASISLYQGVEVPLVGPQVSLLSKIDIVENRSAHVAITFDTAAPAGTRAELRFVRGNVSEGWVESVDPAKPSEVHFRVPRSAVQGTVRAELRFFSDGDCSEARLLREPPAQVETTFVTRSVGAPRVVLVPLSFETDGSGRLPDLEPNDVAELTSALEAVFPISGVEVTVREPYPTHKSDLPSILTEVLALRDAEAVDQGVAYFAFVKPAETMEDYCGEKCVAGIATSGGSDGSLSAGVGVGFRGHNTETYVHEMGHIFGLKHSPCGNVSNPDSAFPYPDARLGRTGYDVRSDTFISAESDARDFMSYCDPTWISDYNYQNLLDRIALTNYAFAGGAQADGGGGQQFDYVNVGPEFSGEHESTISVETETETGLRATLSARRLEVGDGEGVILRVPRQNSIIRSVRRVD